MVTKIKRPYPLFDAIREQFNLPSDAHLASLLHVSAPAIAKVRAGASPMTADLILSVYDGTGWSIETIRGYINGADTREQSQSFGHDDS